MSQRVYAFGDERERRIKRLQMISRSICTFPSPGARLQQRRTIRHRAAPTFHDLENQVDTGGKGGVRKYPRPRSLAQNPGSKSTGQTEQSSDCSRSSLHGLMICIREQSRSARAVTRSQSYCGVPVSQSALRSTPFTRPGCGPTTPHASDDQACSQG